MEDTGRRLCHVVGEIPDGGSEFHVRLGLGIGLRFGLVGPAKLQQHLGMRVLVGGDLIAIAIDGIEVEGRRRIHHANLANDPVIGRVNRTAIA